MAIRFDPILNNLLTKYVKTTGDTMTGALIITPAGNETLTLSLTGTIAGSTTGVTGLNFGQTLTTTGASPAVIRISSEFQPTGAGTTSLAAGINNQPTFNPQTGRTITSGIGFYASFITGSGGGVLTSVDAIRVEAGGYDAVEPATATGVRILDIGLGVATTGIGIDVDAQTGATTGIGVRIALGTTYSLQLSSTAGTAASGITWGTDANLYRIAANVLASDDSLRALGYGYFGSVGAPTNTTAGDLTAVRLKVVDGAFGTGVDFSVTGDGALSGFLRVGSETAPANTTAGDLTITRLALSDNTAFGGSGRFLRFTGTLTATSGTEYGWFCQPSVTPASNSTASFRTLGFDAIWNPTTGITQTTLMGGLFQWRIRGDGLVTNIVGIQGSGAVLDSSSAATTQATNVTCFSAVPFARPSGTSNITVGTLVGLDIAAVTNNGLTTTDYIGIRINNGTNPTNTNQYGIQIASLTRHTTDLWGIQVGFPGIQTSQGTTTNLIGIGLATASVVLSNQTATTTMIAGIYLGIPTYTSTTNVRTVTNMANLYIAGAPVASTNVTVTNGPYSIWVDGGSSRFDGTLILNAKIATYNSVATTNWGVPAIYGSEGRVTAQTAQSAAVASYTVGAADGSFEVSGNVLVTASTTHSFSLDVAYTDESNTARTLILPMVQLAGNFVTGGLITNVTGAGPYESPVIHIRCKAATTITIRPSAGTFTSVTYNAEGIIKQVA